MQKRVESRSFQPALRPSSAVEEYIYIIRDTVQKASTVFFSSNRLGINPLAARANLVSC